MSEWIKWEGGDCPVPPDTKVFVRLRGGVEHTYGTSADVYMWDHDYNGGDIVAYKVAEPETGTKPKGTNPKKEACNGLDVDATLNERGERYGKFSGHSEIAQVLKHQISQFADIRGCRLASDQAEALDMICHKIARIINGDPNYSDSWIDIAGYAKLVADRLNGVEK